MSKRRIPGHRLHKPTGLGYIRINGKPYYTGRWKSDAAEARYQELLAAYLRDEPLPAKSSLQRTRGHRSGPSIESLCADYLDYSLRKNAKTGGPKSKQHRNIRYSLEPLIELFGGTAAGDFGPKALRRYMVRLAEDGRALSTITKRTALVKQMFKWAVSDEQLPPEVHAGLLLAAGLVEGEYGVQVSDPVCPVEWARVKATMRELRGCVRVMVAVHWWTGMRPSELASMRWEDLDTSRNPWVYRPRVHKNKWRKGHEVLEYSLGPRARAALAALGRPAHSG